MPSSGTSARILICGTNWIGDTVMSMPALQACRRRHPGAQVTLLVKESVRALWSLHPVPDRILTLRAGLAGTREAVRAIRAERFDVAYVFPNSFRSALIPWLAGVPDRIGAPGHARRALLTRAVNFRADSTGRHQAYEYVELLAPDGIDEPLETPRLAIPEAARDRARAMLEGAGRPRLGLLPGAARGPSKQWPREHFLALAHRWIRELQGGVAIFGSSAETELCGELAAAAGRGAISLAARLDIPEWAAALSLCDVVVANDSGGMHVAAAVGAPVVALFGMTDPARTGPLGPRCVVLQESPTRARDIPRGSPEARKWLAAIQPDRVYETAQSLLGG